MSTIPTPEFKTSDPFDRALGALAGLPDVISTKPTPVETFSPLVGAAQSFTVRTLRQRERGDTIFLTYIDGAGSMRIVLPPEVADAIARQRDALTTKNRRRAAKESAQARKAAGIVPAFLSTKKRKRTAKGGAS